MRNELEDAIGVIDNQEIESPVPIHPGLPEIACLIILLRAQRRVPKILFKKLCLLEKSLSQRCRSVLQSVGDRFGVFNLHRERLLVFLVAARFFSSPLRGEIGRASGWESGEIPV